MAELTIRPEEIRDALNEGIHIEYLVAPVEARGKDGNIASLVCRRMTLGAPDAGGRRRPVPVPGSDFEIEVDTLIPAISQKSEVSFAPGVALAGHSIKHYKYTEVKPESQIIRELTAEERRQLGL